MRTIENQSPPYEKADVESGMTIDRELKLLARSACVERDPLRAEIDYACRCVAFGYNHGVFDLSVPKRSPRKPCQIATQSFAAQYKHSYHSKRIRRGRNLLKYIEATISLKKLPVSNGQEVARWRMSLIPPQ